MNLILAAARHARLVLVVGSLIPALFAGILPTGPIVQPVAVSSTHAPDPFVNAGGVGDLNSIIDQSGFFTQYVSGETEFDGYVATELAVQVPASLGGIGPGLPGEIDFDLGSINRIDAIAIWNQTGGAGSAALRKFDLLVSVTADFAGATVIGSFDLPVRTGDLGGVHADVFTFTPVPARFVRIVATQNDGFPDATRINEFAVRRAVFGTPTGRIAFLRNPSSRNSGSGVYVIDADGTDETALVTHAGSGLDDFESVQWSPDGSRLLFTADSGGDADIYVVNEDGSNLANITNTPDVDDVNPRWSPDGRRIAFPAGGGINVMNPDGSSVMLLTPDGDCSRWSPDGGRISFRRTRDIYLINTDGSGEVAVTRHPETTSALQHIWSPDGSRIAFATDTFDPFGSGTETDIRIVNVNGGGSITLPMEETGGGEIVWAPDGSQIAFNNVTRGYLLTNADGSGQEVALCERCGPPRWSTDGSRIAFAMFDSDFSRADIFVGNADGSNSVRLTNSPGVDDEPDWRSSAVAPEITGVLDGAGSLPKVAPGGTFQVFLPPGTVPMTATSTTVPLSTNLGLSVLVDGQFAALFGVFAGENFDQVNGVVPWGVTPGSQVPFSVVQNGALVKGTSPFLVQVDPASPGLYTFQFGIGPAIVQNLNDFSFAHAEGSLGTLDTRPATPGGIIIAWANGLGPISGTVPDGDVPGLGSDLIVPTKQVRLFIGGQEATILGTPVLHPTLVALFQINAIVPGGITPGDEVPIEIEVDFGDGQIFRSRSDVFIAVGPAQP